MKVLDLSCENRHLFEGWFQSEDDYADQCRTGVLVCPVCESPQVRKRLSAPRLNLGKSQSSQGHASVDSGPQQPTETEAAEVQGQKAWMQALRGLMASSEDVGRRFADEARRMHQGEIEARRIHGQATMSEAVALLQEGVGIVPLPDLPLLKTPLQ